MAGTKQGGQLARDKNYEKYGKDFYKKIGAKGGKLGTTGGFYHMKMTGQTEKIAEAGRKGGTISRRLK